MGGDHVAVARGKTGKREKALRPLVGKKVESVRVDDCGVVYITAAGFGGRVVVKIGEPW